MAGEPGSPSPMKRLAGRLPALLALGLPVLCGLAYMALFGAPAIYLLLNGAALLLGLLWIALGFLPRHLMLRRSLALMLIVLLFLPLLTGPRINDIARWLPLGPLALHAGMLALPPLVVLAASDEDDGALLLLVALFATLLQPDGSSAFAITFACVGLYRARQDWKVGAVMVAAFVVAIIATLRGELPALPFVERVLVDAAFAMPAVALVLLAALVASLFLILFPVSLPRASRFALAGSLFGFAVSALMSNYPTPLIGFGAAPILGYALALSDRSILSLNPEPAR